MATPKSPIKITKVEVLLKTGELSTTKLDFENSRAELYNNFLLIKTNEEDSVTTKLFNINEISAYKEYYNITQ